MLIRDEGGLRDSEKRKGNKNNAFKTPVIVSEVERKTNQDLLR
jgi:hypothetical protein